MGSLSARTQCLRAVRCYPALITSIRTATCVTMRMITRTPMTTPIRRSTKSTARSISDAFL